MQLGILGLLLGIPNGALTGGQGQGSNAAGADVFAQLLGDAGAEGGHYQAASSFLQNDKAPGALLAQEVAATNGETLDTLTELLAKEISAEDAAALLEQLDTLAGGEGGEGEPMLAQLRDTLTQIKETKTPMTVGAVLAQLPAPAGMPVERAPLAERLLAWLRGAASKQEESPTQDAAVDADVDAPSPTTQSLQATMFHDANIAAASAQEASGERDYVEIVALSQQLTTAPIWVRQLTEQAAPQGNAELIAPLNVPVGRAAEAADENAGELPELQLPKVSLMADEPVNDNSKVTDLSVFRAIKENDVAQRSPSPVIADDGVASDAPASQTVQPSQHGQSPLMSEHRSTLHVASAHSPLNHAPVAAQVQVVVQRAVKDGIDQITLQLEPADLGRIEVQLTHGADGRTQLSFLADKAETLDQLARDARHLERAMQEAGVKADAGSMQFNLRQQPSQQAMDGEQGGNGQQAWRGQEQDEAAAQAAAATTQHYTVTLKDGVDIRA